MRVSIHIDSLERVGELAGQVLDLVSRVEVLRPRKLVLRDYDRGEVAESDVLAIAARDPKGGLAMRTPAGTLHLSWRYVPNAWFQLVGGQFAVSEAGVHEIVPVVRELSDMLRSAYSRIDLADVCDHDASAFSGEGVDDPWDRLDDLYWYNYFGPELTHVLRDEHQLLFDVIGVRQRQLTHGWEVYLDGVPRARPYHDELVKYLTAANVFRKYRRKARFRSGRTKFDYSRVRTP
jgi:hypothetical protein